MKVVLAAVLTALILGLLSIVDVDIKEVRCRKDQNFYECVREYRIAYYDYQIKSYRKKYWDAVGEKYVGNETQEERFWKESVMK